MIPNIPGLGGSPFFATGGGGLNNAQAQYNRNQAYFGDQSRTLAAGSGAADRSCTVAAALAPSRRTMPALVRPMDVRTGGFNAWARTMPTPSPRSARVGGRRRLPSGRYARAGFA